MSTEKVFDSLFYCFKIVYDQFFVRFLDFLYRFFVFVDNGSKLVSDDATAFSQSVL